MDPGRITGVRPEYQRFGMEEETELLYVYVGRAPPADEIPSLRSRCTFRSSRSATLLPLADDAVLPDLLPCRSLQAAASRKGQDEPCCYGRGSWS